MKFTIDRSKWRCGDVGENAVGEGQTALLNPQGFLCCLGHVALQCGADEQSILNVGIPREVERLKNLDTPLTEWADDFDPDDGYEPERFRDSVLSNDAIKINDDKEIVTATREKKLKALFKKHGHELVFTGEAVRP